MLGFIAVFYWKPKYKKMLIREPMGVIIPIVGSGGLEMPSLLKPMIVLAKKNSSNALCHIERSRDALLVVNEKASRFSTSLEMTRSI
ncbi:hypothetical protein D3C85_1768670 [compost metagenome]